MADAQHNGRHFGDHGGRRPTWPRDNEGTMASRNFPDTGEPIVRTFHWLRWTDSDYLAARYLLLGRMVIQGCVLANTAIEKYLKALHAHLELPISRSHAVQTLYAELKTSAKSTVTLNESFLGVLQKAYRLRYPDGVPDDFNISLNQMKLLAELGLRPSEDLGKTIFM
uniref:HEPN domain-containing protein n=1 Tax=Solibacter usitatus (strain Ellin6076) TaxID=234267 RepID=Q01RG1_SOLUE